MFKILKTAPYVKKQNRMGDTSSWQSWHMHLRVCKQQSENEEKQAPIDEHEKFFTVIRHKYQPPLMEYFTDLAVVSKKKSGFEGSISDE